MKNLLIIFMLLFSTVFFSSPSYAEWTKVVEGASGNTCYVDFEKTRKHGGLIYYWYMSDYLTPETNGDLSAKEYRQSDCKFFRYKIISSSFYKEPMGGGISFPHPFFLIEDWKYPGNSIDGTILKSVCSHQLSRIYKFIVKRLA